VSGRISPCFSFPKNSQFVFCSFSIKKKTGKQKMASMTKHEIKICPHCSRQFECKVGDVVNCQCSILTLSAETHTFLDKTDFDCLCVSCLGKFNEMQSKSFGFEFPNKREQMIEGLHYYLENGFWVFTEFYHFLRGNCCQSGCRHCVYGFKKEEKPANA